MSEGRRRIDISASLVLYRNQPRQIAAALDGFVPSPLNVCLEAVDNSPADNLRGLVKARGAEYIWTGKNLGFGAGHNIAIRDVLNRSAYHLVLNPDVRFEAGVLEALYEFMEANPAVGLVMPKVLYPDGSVQYLCKCLPTPFDLFARRFLRGPLACVVRGRNDRYELRNLDFDRVLSVPALSGCFMLIRTEAFKTSGLFDERYFMYMEDVDLCRRIRRNWDTVYFPRVHVFHEYAKGSYTNSRLFHYHMASAWRYFNKWGWFFDPERRSANRTALNQSTVTCRYNPMSEPSAAD